MAGDERRYGLYNTNSREERSTPVDTASVKTEVEGGRDTQDDGILIL